MKVYLQPDTASRGILRVCDALIDYLPNHVGIASEPSEADLTVLHVWGRQESTKRKIDALKASGKQYAIIQYVLRSSMRPHTKDWIDMWNGAKLVWSYYDLPQLCIDDGIRHAPFDPPNFYHAPLGVDASVFYKINEYKPYVIATCSQGYLTEGVKEAYRASRRVGKRMFNLGMELNKEGMDCKTGITDEELAMYYSQSQFVSGLRRVEGFELPVIEGLLCGARPIVFDRPEMRKWFGNYAVFIPEEDREKTVDNLEHIFKMGAKPVTDEELALAKKQFDWSIIVGEFWKRVL